MNRLPLFLLLAATGSVFLGCGPSQDVVESPASVPPAATSEEVKADPPPSAEAKPAETGGYLDDPSPNPPPQSAKFSVEQNAVVLPGSITFERGSARIRKESLPALEHLAAYMTDKTYVTLIRIEGHVEDGANGSENQSVSEARAVAVSRWLVKRGIDCKRVLPVGFGATKPIASRQEPGAAEKNTRIVAVNAQLRGIAIGGMDVVGGGNRAGDPCK